MAPTSTTDDVRDGFLGNAVVTGEGLLSDTAGRVALSKFKHFRFSHLGPIDTLATTQPARRRAMPQRMAAFLVHVAQVVLLSSKEQMSRIHTRRVVAAMAHAQLRAEGAVHHRVHRPVGKQSLFLKGDSAIAKGITPTGPFPTVADNVKAPAHSISQRRVSELIGAFWHCGDCTSAGYQNGSGA